MSSMMLDSIVRVFPEPALAIILVREDFDDAAATIEHFLLEDSTLIASEGQIPHASLRFSSGPEILDEDIPQRVIQLGSRAIVKSSVIEIRSS